MSDQTCVMDWEDRIREFDKPRILHTGAKIWPNSAEQKYKQRVPHGRWIGTDVVPGDGVDIVADIHCIDEDKDLRGTFDGVYSESTLEHLARPWYAMNALSRLMRSGGFMFIQTHQTFPLHYYSDDFYRFSTSAIKVLAQDAGLEVVSAKYEFPCQIIPPAEITCWQKEAPSFLNVCLCAVKL